MANNLVQLQTDIKAAFGANLDAATIQKVRDRFVSAYQGEWHALVAGGQADTVANRNNFAVKKVFDYMQSIYQGESAKANITALPAPDVIA